jgi:hypothetical protein
MRRMKKIILALLLAGAAPAMAAVSPVAIALDAVTGSDITADQINAVRDYELTLIDDPDPVIAEAAAGWVHICDRALTGQPRDRSKVAARYNELVDDGTIVPVP